MFSHLINIDNRLYERYITIEKNIKSASNSFYDSFLDFQEQLVRIIALSFDAEISMRDSCGHILQNDKIIDIFTNTLHLDNYTLDKMKKYTLKVNSHKHKNEKTIQLDTIISYMTILYTVTSKFAIYKGYEVKPFNTDYIYGIYGIYEKENITLKDEVNSLKMELESSVLEGKLKEKDIKIYKNLISQADLEKYSLAEQNQELLKQISTLKDIKLSSMEEKLNKSLDLLNALTDSVIENRAVSYAVGDSICGKDKFQEFIDKAKTEIMKTPQRIDKLNNKLSQGVNVVKTINDFFDIFKSDKHK